MAKFSMRWIYTRGKTPSLYQVPSKSNFQFSNKFRENTKKLRLHALKMSFEPLAISFESQKNGAMLHHIKTCDSVMSNRRVRVF